MDYRENQSCLIRQYGDLVKGLKEHKLEVSLSSESFAATNVKHLKLGEYSTHWIFATFKTVDEGLAYMRGIEDGKKLSQPEREKK